MSVATFPQEALSWLGRLPAGWHVKPLKHVVRVNPEALPNSTDPDWRMTYADISSVFLGQGIVDAEELTFEEAPSRARRLVRPGDTLVSTVRTYLRAITVVRKPPQNLVASTGFAVLRPGSAIDPNFLGYFATSDAFVNAVVAQSVGVSYPATNASDIVRLPIAFPAIGQQQKIAAFLDRKTAEIDSLIARKRRLLELLAEKRTALITRAVTKGLNPDAPMKDSGIEWLGEIPVHWHVTSFRWRCSVASGQVDPCEPDYAALPLIAPDHIESNTGRLLEVTSADEQGAISGKYFFPKGTLLYSKIRPNLSKVCIAPFDGLCSADMYPIIPSNELETKYLMYQLLADRFKSYAVMQSLRVAMPKLNREALGSAPIVVPPIEEQEDIIRYVDGVWAEIDGISSRIHAAIIKLEEYRSALITNAVTGQIKVA